MPDARYSRFPIQVEQAGFHNPFQRFDVFLQ